MLRLCLCVLFRQENKAVLTVVAPEAQMSTQQTLFERRS